MIARRNVSLRTKTGRRRVTGRMWSRIRTTYKNNVFPKVRTMCIYRDLFTLCDICHKGIPLSYIWLIYT